MHYHEADLPLSFRLCILLVFSCGGSSQKMIVGLSLESCSLSLMLSFDFDGVNVIVIVAQFSYTIFF